MDESKFKLDDFELYQRACALRKRLYQLIRQLPPEEKYCLAMQMRRAALSISNNIAEGHGRWFYRENIHFCQIARGSTEEIIDDLNACMDENYADHGQLQELKAEGYELVRKINGYIAYLRKVRPGSEDAS